MRIEESSATGASATMVWRHAPEAVLAPYGLGAPVLQSITGRMDYDNWRIETQFAGTIEGESGLPCTDDESRER